MATTSITLVFLLLLLNFGNAVQARWHKLQPMQDPTGHTEHLLSPSDADVTNSSSETTTSAGLLTRNIPPLTALEDSLPLRKDVSHLNTSTVKLQRRQCVWNDQAIDYDCDFKLPTLFELLDRFRDAQDGGRATPQNSVYFYTNLPVSTSDEVYETFFNIRNVLVWLGVPNYYDVFDGLSSAWREVQERQIVENMDEFRAENPGVTPMDDPHNVFFRCIYQAAAAAALNPDAYLFTPSATSWRPDSVWQTGEYPVLARNPNVLRIWRVDPRPQSATCGLRELLWSRQRGDTPPPLGYLCPILS